MSINSFLLGPKISEEPNGAVRREGSEILDAFRTALRLASENFVEIAISAAVRSSLTMFRVDARILPLVIVSSLSSEGCRRRLAAAEVKSIKEQALILLSKRVNTAERSLGERTASAEVNLAAGAVFPYPKEREELSLQIYLVDYSKGVL